jgi:hypothetical protein
MDHVRKRCIHNTRSFVVDELRKHELGKKGGNVRSCTTNTPPRQTFIYRLVIVFRFIDVNSGPDTTMRVAGLLVHHGRFRPHEISRISRRTRKDTPSGHSRRTVGRAGQLQRWHLARLFDSALKISISMDHRCYNTAKNHAFTSIDTSPGQYSMVQECLEANNGGTTLIVRRNLAAFPTCFPAGAALAVE